MKKTILILSILVSFACASAQQQYATKMPMPAKNKVGIVMAAVGTTICIGGFINERKAFRRYENYNVTLLDGVTIYEYIVNKKKKLADWEKAGETAGILYIVGGSIAVAGGIILISPSKTGLALTLKF